MNIFCPKAFSHDMTDPANLAYCRSLQSFERCSKCEFYVVDSASKKHIPETKKETESGHKQISLF